MALYVAPVVQNPSLQEVANVAQSLNLDIPDEELTQYHELVSGLDKRYSVLEKYIEPDLQPVKYPRTPGYRPQPEHKYNAWYYKCEIPGASSGLLHGMKVAIKDSIPVAGVPMMCGARVFESYVPNYDPTVVTRILDAGATIMGKSTCESFCYSSSSFTSHPAPVLNPHNLNRSCGGSSSGAAVLVQQEEVDLSLGGDQGGSIRMPASWTGIVGLKPTYGLVPYTSINSMNPAVDHCGPMARTVKDCALLLQAIAGDDGGLDMRQRNIPTTDHIPKYSELLSDNLNGKSVGLVTEGFDWCSEDVQKIVRDAAMRLSEKGATVENVSIPIHKDATVFWGALVTEGLYSTTTAGQGYTIGPPGFHPTSAIEANFNAVKTRSKDMPINAKAILITGKYISENYGIRLYTKSQNLMWLVKEKYDEALKTHDVIVMPTMTTTAAELPVVGSTIKDLADCANNPMINVAPFNGTGHPSVSINAGYSDGLPVGMMITRRHHDDLTVLNVAYAHEQILQRMD